MNSRLSGKKTREERGREEGQNLRAQEHKHLFAELPPLQGEEVNLSGQGGSDPFHSELHHLQLFLSMP